MSWIELSSEQTRTLARDKGKDHKEQGLRSMYSPNEAGHLPLFLPPFLPPSRPLSPSRRARKPPRSRASLATAEMHLHRSEPSLTPPYHRKTTRITSSQFPSSNNRSRRSPAPASPPLDEPNRTMLGEALELVDPAGVGRTLHAYIACEARRVCGSTPWMCARSCGTTLVFMRLGVLAMPPA